MPLPTLVLGCVVVGLVLLVILRRILVKLVGPVLGFDAVRTARRSRLSLLRAGYAFVLLLVLFLVYVREFGLDLRSGLAELMDDQSVSVSEGARFAERFFHLFLVAQFLAVLILAPAFTAGAIAEEREKGTLPLLLASDLRSREIILGKLLARLGHLVLLLLAGVPILSLLQLLGGVDPTLVVGGFALTLLSALGVGSLAMLCSVKCRRTRDSLFFTYIWIGAYQFLSVCGAGVFKNNAHTLEAYILGMFGSGNIVVLYARLTELSHSGKLTTGLLVLLTQALVFHVWLGAVCLSQAIKDLRSSLFLSPETPLPQATRDHTGRLIVRRRLRLWDGAPMIWKECHVERGLEVHPLGRGILQVTLVLVGVLAGLIFTCGMFLSVSVELLSNFSNWFLSLCLPLTAGVGMLGLAVRAAGVFAGEREHQTLDGLLTTDLTRWDILTGKWCGCIYQLRHVGTVLGVLVFVGMLTGGIHPLWAILEVLTLAAHGCFAVSLGMYCSLLCRTTFRATVVTVAVLLGVGFGHWLCFIVAASLCQWCGWSQLIGPLAHFHHVGLTPTVTQLHYLVPLVPFDVATPGWAEFLGVLLYAGLALGLWKLLFVRFSSVTGRR